MGVDNYSKYGKLHRAHNNHDKFFFNKCDVTSQDFSRLVDWLQPDYVIACAAMIGGIQYFHQFAYDLLATNERILASTFDSAIKCFQKGNLKRIIVLSSSMVFENTNVYPTPEDNISKCPPPSSTYGFQKLASEYFCKGAYEEYGLPYTIIRPFNCVGVGEDASIKESEVTSGNVKMMLSHVLPDLINKIMLGQSPLHILGSGGQIRCYTNGKDIARGIHMALESDAAINNDFNISTSEVTTVLQLAEMIWKKLNPGMPFSYISDDPFTYDVQKRIPDVSKAEKILGFKAEISLEQSVDEVIQYMKDQKAKKERNEYSGK